MDPQEVDLSSADIDEDNRNPFVNETTYDFKFAVYDAAGNRHADDLNREGLKYDDLQPQPVISVVKGTVSDEGVLTTASTISDGDVVSDVGEKYIKVHWQDSGLNRETMTGFAVGDISVSTGTLGALVDPDEAAADYYYVPITLSDNGQVDIDIDATVAIDEAANDNTAAATFSFIYDDIHPTLAITAKSEENNNLIQGGTYKGDGYIEFTFTLNDANPDLTALTRGDINESIPNGFVLANATWNDAAAPVYTLRIPNNELQENRMIRVMIPQESVRDLGNKQLASDAVLSIFFDKAAPGLPTITVFGGPEEDLQPINIDRDGDGDADTDVAGGVFFYNGPGPFTITYDWEDEKMPLTFTASNVGINNMVSEGEVTNAELNLTDIDDEYEFFGIHNTTKNVYYTRDEARPWSAHNDDANGFGTGAHLVVIEDVQENTFVTDIRTYLSSSMWIGLQDVGGVWTWVDGTEPTYDNWNAGEPSGNGIYGHMWSSGTWDDFGNEVLGSMRAVIELEATAINNFTQVLTPDGDPSSGLVEVTLTDVTDGAQNTTSQETFSFWYDTDAPEPAANLKSDYENRTNDHHPEITISAMDKVSSGTDKITVSISNGSGGRTWRKSGSVDWVTWEDDLLIDGTADTDPLVPVDTDIELGNSANPDLSLIHI